MRFPHASRGRSGATVADRKTRREFLKLGAAGAAGTAFGGTLLRLASAQAQLPRTIEVELFITEGTARMVDGTPVFLRSFSATPDFTQPDVAEPLRSIEGDLYRVTITNTLDEPHSFFVPDIVESGPIAPGASVTVDFDISEAGTYVYVDDDPVQRALGLEGVIVVDPIDGSSRPYIDGPEYVPPDFIWNIHEIDSVWGELARRRRSIDPSTFLPRYFTINGKSGLESIETARNAPHRKVGEITLLRVVNTGLAGHAMHWHGNHVEVLSENGRVLDLVVRKDVVRFDPLDRKDVLLPVEPPGDVFPPPDPAKRHVFVYPIHDHVEMTQTAAGGNYPSGMLTDWEIEIEPDPGAVASTTAPPDDDSDSDSSGSGSGSSGSGSSGSGSSGSGSSGSGSGGSGSGGSGSGDSDSDGDRLDFACDPPKVGSIDTPGFVTPAEARRLQADGIINDLRRFERKFFNDNIKMPGGKEVEIWSFEDDRHRKSYPAPLIRVSEGDLVQTTVKSSKGPHTIHHHGVEPDTFNDGVGHTSFEVSGSYTYQWRAREGSAGTYFYHCHVNTVLHAQMGMFGPLIIDPPEGPGRGFDGGPAYDVEALWACHEIDPRWHELNHAAGLCGEDEGLNDFRPRFFLINGVPHPRSLRSNKVTVTARVRQRILLRLLNAGYFPAVATFGGLDVKPVASDGRPFIDRTGLPTAFPRTKSLLFGAAERYDVLIRPRVPGTFVATFEFHNWLTNEVAGIVQGKIIVSV